VDVRWWVGSGHIPEVGLAAATEGCEVVPWFMTFESSDEEGRFETGGQELYVRGERERIRDVDVRWRDGHDIVVKVIVGKGGNRLG
jgi:hypothetical protein